MIEIEKYKNHDIVKNGDEYRIIWDRGKKDGMKQALW